MSWMMVLRRALGVTTCLVVMGCSHAVRIEPSDYDAVEFESGESYRVRTNSGGYYVVRRMSVEGSALVVTKADDKNLKRVEVPFRIHFADIESIERLDLAEKRTFVLLFVGMLTTLAIIGIATMGPLDY